MDYQHITCILGLTAVVFFGFLIIALAFFWPNEANAYLAVFCLVNGILAVVGATEVTQSDDYCRWNAVLRMLCLTLGFEMLYRNQLLRSCLMSCAASFAPWNFYDYNPALKTCFIKPTGLAQLEETVVSFFWFLFSCLRPVALTTRWIPRVIYQSHKQIQVLRHERELNVDVKLLLYKDHHRRLFHVVTSVASEVVFVLWVLLTLPYVIQVIGAVVGLSALMRLEEMTDWQSTAFILAARSLPIASCLIFLAIYLTYFLCRMKG